MEQDQLLSLGLEAIQVQQDKAFGKAIEDWVIRARQEYRQNDRHLAPSFYTELAAVFKKFTGMKVTVFQVGRTNEVNAGAAFPTRAHLGNGERSHLNQYGRVHEEGFDWFLGKGNVNYLKGTVSGALSELENYMYFEGGLFTSESILSVEEATGIILHEVGHCFTSLSTIEFVILTNYYLTDGLEALLSGDARFKTRTVDASKILGEYITDPELRELILSGKGERADWQKAIVMATSNKRREQFKSVGMGDRRDEQLADLYASRQGYGRHIATGLAKATQLWGDSSNTFMGSGQFAFIEAMKVLQFTIIVAGTAVVNPVLAGCFLVATVAALFVGSNNEDMHYDRCKARFTKFKNDLVFQLRQKNLNPEFRKSVIDDIDVLDELLKTMNDARTVFDALSSFVNPKYRNRYQHRHQEEKLEALLNNDLFVTALRRQ